MALSRGVILRKVCVVACVLVFLGCGAKGTCFSVEHDSFKQLIDTTQEPVLVYDAGTWLEGPQVLPNGSLVVSDVKANRLLLFARGIESGDGVLSSEQYTHSVILAPSYFQNGHALDMQGRLIAASHGKRAIERLNHDGNWEVLVDSYMGKRLNSPNDVIVDSDGDIWFSDPKFGLINPHESYGGNIEQDGDFVYRYSPRDNIIKRLDTPLLQAPNGLALSPDEKILYVADSELAYDFTNADLKHHIIAYDVNGDKSLANARIFAVIDEGIPDGIKVDRLGNLYASSGNGVHVFAPSGRKIGQIIFPEVVGNLAFSLDAQFIDTLEKHGVEVSPDFMPLLYVTSGSKLYVLRTHL